MKFSSDFTKEQLKKDSDPLSFACHPLAKLRMVAGIIFNSTYKTDSAPFDGCRSDEVAPLNEIIYDAASDIESLINAADEKYNELSNQNDDLKAKILVLEKQLEWEESITQRARTQMLERTLKDFCFYLEDPDDKPDLKTMAKNLRKVLNN